MTFKSEYVTLIEYMGSDLRVIDSARVSFNKQSSWDSNCMNWDAPPKLKPKDAKLVNYLAKHKHWTPFSHCMVTLQLKMPVFIRAQWFKHTVGFTRNEVSRRYVNNPPEFWHPEEWRMKAADKKQGSSEAVYDGKCSFSYHYKEICKEALETYDAMIEEGIAPEQARMILPQSMMTEFYETASLAAYARLYGLRSSPDAQKEIKDYAERVGDIIRPLFPVSWEALTKIEEKTSE